MSKIIAPLLFLIASIGLYFSYISPSLVTLGQATDLKDRLESAVAKYNELFDRRESLRDSYAAIPVADEQNLHRILPDEIDPVRIIIDIDRLARSPGINLQVSSFELPRAQVTQSARGGEEEKNQLMTWVMATTVEGSYASFKTFLATLERSLTIFDVTQIEIEKIEAAATTDRGQRYKVTMHIYSLK
jgi:hypothetical protein